MLGERERKTGEKICQRGGLGEFQRSADELDRSGSPESEKPTEVVREQGAPGSHQDNELAQLRWSPGSIGAGAAYERTDGAVSACPSLGPEGTTD